MILTVRVKGQNGNLYQLFEEISIKCMSDCWKSQSEQIKMRRVEYFVKAPAEYSIYQSFSQNESYLQKYYASN